MSGGGSSGDTQVHYPGYIEWHRQNLVDREWEEVQTVWRSSPYSGEVVLDPNDIFCGGDAIETFPSLFDMFGKFMAGLDVEVLWTQIYHDMVDNPEIARAIQLHWQELSREVENVSIPRMSLGMRDVNAVMTSSFQIAKENIEGDRIFAGNKFAADMKLKAVDIAQQRWDKHLTWNAQVIEMYAKVLQLFVASYNDLENMKIDFAVKDKQWASLAMENYRVALSTAMGGGYSGNAASAGPSQAAKSVSGAMAGAAIGTQISPGYGTVIGAVVGLAASFF